MNFSLIICTYLRPQALLKLLRSVKNQTLYPNEILIIDGSINNETQVALKQNHFNNLKYFKVEPEDRGLTKQRNYGINLISNASEVVCFLDDDIILTSDYFQNLIKTYQEYPEALAVGGYITNEVRWVKSKSPLNDNSNTFCFDGWERSEPFRFRLRQKFGLQPDTRPGFLPTFAHGRSIGFLPPSGKTYPVELLMGGVSSYRKSVFKTLSFSTYFEGYGLYEDADFSLRIAKKGKLYVNTKAKLSHYHEVLGRPNQYEYGKMVIRNGWYVWRIKYPNPNLKSRLKWNITVCFLTIIRFTNSITTSKKQEAFTESVGRVVGWLSLFFNKPNVNR